MTIHLGYLPLTDCLPLLVAQQQGFFAAQGLEVSLCQELSWANLRDKIGVGILQGGHCLAPLPLAAQLAIGTPKMPLVTALGLSLNGNGITVSQRLFEAMCEINPHSETQPQVASDALFNLIQKERAKGAPPRRFAAVLPISSHFYLLNRWLGPSVHHVERVIVTPPLMVSQLRAGLIDGYCVGEPWNSLAVAEGIGAVVATSEQLWPDHWEKVFAVNALWLENHLGDHQKLLVALLQAASWLATPDHRALGADYLATVMPEVPLAVIQASLVGPWRAHRADPGKVRPRFHVFSELAATDPHPQQAAVWLQEMRALGQFDEQVPLVTGIYRQDLYAQAVAAWQQWTSIHGT